MLWPVLMAVTGLASSVQLLTLPFFPESPPHLFLRRGDEEACLKGTWARGSCWGAGRGSLFLLARFCLPACLPA